MNYRYTLLLCGSLLATPQNYPASRAVARLSRSQQEYLVVSAVGALFLYGLYTEGFFSKSAHLLYGLREYRLRDPLLVLYRLRDTYIPHYREKSNKLKQLETCINQLDGAADNGIKAVDWIQRNKGRRDIREEIQAWKDNYGKSVIIACKEKLQETLKQPEYQGLLKEVIASSESAQKKADNALAKADNALALEPQLDEILRQRIANS